MNAPTEQGKQPSPVDGPSFSRVGMFKIESPGLPAGAPRTLLSHADLTDASIDAGPSREGSSPEIGPGLGLVSGVITVDNRTQTTKGLVYPGFGSCS